MLYRIFYILIVMIISLSSPVLVNKAMAEDDVGIVAVDDLDLIFNDQLIVDDMNLNEMRGAALDIEVLGIAIFDAVSINNSASGTVSGGNVIDTGAFSNSSGLSTIIQNSGNNVLIQSATILTLDID